MGRAPERRLPGLYRRLASAEERVRRILSAIRVLEAHAVVAAPGRRISRPTSAPAGPGLKTPNLVEALARLLKKKAMSPAEAADGVRRAGIRSPASALLKAVTRALTDNPRFARAGRGRFRSAG